jgi:hypothetical protein
MCVADHATICRKRVGAKKGERMQERERKREHMHGRRGEHAGKGRAHARSTLLVRVASATALALAVLCSHTATTPARRWEKKEAHAPFAARKRRSMPLLALLLVPRYAPLLC